MKRYIFLLIILVLLVGCSTKTNTIHQNAENNEDVYIDEKEEYKELEIIDRKDFKYGEHSETYLLTIQNPNSNYGGYLVDLVFTYRDSENRILDNFEHGFIYIAPKDIYILSVDRYIDFEYETLDITIKNKEDSIYRGIYSEYGTSTDFDFNNISLFNDTDDRKVTGEITNNSENYYSLVDMEIILKLDGEVVGVKGTIIHDIGSKDTAVFSEDLPKYYDYDDVEFFAYGYMN